MAALPSWPPEVKATAATMNPTALVKKTPFPLTD